MARAAFKCLTCGNKGFSLLGFFSSCASYVGCQGGAQRLYFSKICAVGNLCHELMHALGLHHEHTRKDRDQYVTIKWENILKGKHGTRAHLKNKNKKLDSDIFLL